MRPLSLVRLPAKAALWILAATLFAVPLALVPALQFFDITPKLLCVSVGASLLWLALALENRFPAGPARQARFHLALLALAVCGAAATLLGTDPVLSLVGSDSRRLGLVAWLACLGVAAAVPVVTAGDERRRRLLVAALALAGALAALYGIAQYAGLDPWIDPAVYRVPAGGFTIVRPPSTLGHANFFGLFSVMAFLCALGLAFSSGSRAATAGWSAAAAATALAVVVSGSRGAWVGAVVGLAVLAATTRRRRPFLVGAAAILALLAAVIFSPFGRGIRARFQAAAYDPSIASRLLIWRDSLRLVAAHPLLGTGPDSFELSFPKVQSLRLAEHAPDQYAESTHNVLLDYLTSAGLPAAALLALLAAGALLRYAKAARERPLDSALLAALAGGLAAAQFSGDTIATRLVILALAAMAFSAPGIEVRPKARWLVAGFSLGCLVAVGVFGVLLLRADRDVLAARKAAVRGDLSTALRRGQAAQRALPWTGTHAFVFSRVIGGLLSNSALPLTQRLELLTIAEQSARAALVHSSQPQMVYVHLASILVLQGKQDEAQAALEAAVRAAPAWYRPRWLLAVLLAVRGRHREAAEHAEAALERGARAHPEIAASLAEITRLAPGRKPPPPGTFEPPLLWSGNRYDLCGGGILLPPELRLQRQAAPVLAPGSAGSWDGADVLNPSMVEHNSELLMFYSGFDGNLWRTGLARSHDGNSWQKVGGPVLEPSAFGWDSEFIAANGSVLVEKKTYYHWYQAGRRASIGLAYSGDGVQWRRHPAPVLEPGPPGSWDSEAVADPFVFRCGETLYLYYLGQDAMATQRLGVASSRDGVHWAKYPRNPVLNLGKPGTFDERGLGEPAVLPIARGLAMFYAGRDNSEYRRIGLALSADGLVWRKQSVVLDVVPQGWDSRVVTSPHAFVSGRKLFLWYGGGDVATPDQGLHGHIGLATAEVLKGLPLFIEHAKVLPASRRQDTPNGMWAFPFATNSLVTLPGGSMTFVVDVPDRGRFRASLRMPLEGAEPARAVVRANALELLSLLVERDFDVDLDLRRFSHQRIELRLAGVPGPKGQRASWIEWRYPRVEQVLAGEPPASGAMPARAKARAAPVPQAPRNR